MANTSKKRRNKRIQNISIFAVIAALVVSFIVSQVNKEKYDPANFANLEVEEIAPHYKGNVESGVVLVEYSDFQCPACKATAPNLSQMIEIFGDRFALEYRHLPLNSIHPNAEEAAYAAEAAARQGKFWEMHDELFENQAFWGQSVNPEKHFARYAEELGLNVDRFWFDMESDEVKAVVDRHLEEAKELQLPGTPSFTLNGEPTDLNAFITEYLTEPTSEEEGESHSEM